MKAPPTRRTMRLARLPRNVWRNRQLKPVSPMMVMVTVTAAEPEAYAGPVTIPWTVAISRTVTIIGIAGLHIGAPLNIPS